MVKGHLYIAGVTYLLQVRINKDDFNLVYEFMGLYSGKVGLQKWHKFKFSFWYLIGLCTPYFDKFLLFYTGYNKWLHAD